MPPATETGLLEQAVTRASDKAHEVLRCLQPQDNKLNKFEGGGGCHSEQELCRITVSIHWPRHQDVCNAASSLKLPRAHGTNQYGGYCLYYSWEHIPDAHDVAGICLVMQHCITSQQLATSRTSESGRGSCCN